MMATLGSHFLCSDLSVRLHSSHCDGDAWAEKLTTHYYERIKTCQFWDTILDTLFFLSSKSSVHSCLVMQLKPVTQMPVSRPGNDASPLLSILHFFRGETRIYQLLMTTCWERV